MTPQSTTSIVPSYSYAIMFIPNSPKPPSGMALSFPFRDEILVLLNRSHCPLSAENRLKRAQNLALFGVFEAAKGVRF
jgi:hypothetical protein